MSCIVPTLWRPALLEMLRPMFPLLPLELAVSLVASLVTVALLHAMLWRAHREQYLLWWVAAWLLFACRYSPMLGLRALDSFSGTVVFGILRDFCFVVGASLYAKRPTWRWWGLLTAIELALRASGATARTDIAPVWDAARPALAAAASTLVAVALVANSRPAPVARRVAAAGYLAFAIDAALAVAGIRTAGLFVLDQLAFLSVGVGFALADLEETSALHTQALARLAGTMEHVLRGHANVCSQCHRVEDRSHDWHRPESFVRRPTNANVTHGICPACAKRHFGDFAEAL
jgi:hypothetical protein